MSTSLRTSIHFSWMRFDLCNIKSSSHPNNVHTPQLGCNFLSPLVLSKSTRIATYTAHSLRDIKPKRHGLWTVRQAQTTVRAFPNKGHVCWMRVCVALLLPRKNPSTSGLLRLLRTMTRVAGVAEAIWVHLFINLLIYLFIQTNHVPQQYDKLLLLPGARLYLEESTA